MGEFPARIVAEDFLTPPEFASWRLAHEVTGRIGGTRLALAARAEATQISCLYEQIGPTEPALIYLLNPTNGLMDGDAHWMEIHAGADTRSVVTGQSATRIHPCLNGFCTQQWHVSVADGATLVVLPGPAIPFAGCRYFQRVRIDLAENAQLIWGDLWFAGRYAREEASERFRFEWIVQEMLVQRQGQLVFRDRFAWHGPWDETNARWHFGGHPATGTLFATGSHAATSFVGMEKSGAALFTTAAGDTYCRWTGSSESVIHAVVENSLRLASVMTNGRAEEPWLLTGHHLARTHWFDVV
jgi:urease accessory protein